MLLDKAQLTPVLPNGIAVMYLYIKQQWQNYFAKASFPCVFREAPYGLY
jgi:hypothetical protein